MCKLRACKRQFMVISHTLQQKRRNETPDWWPFSTRGMSTFLLLKIAMKKCLFGPELNIFVVHWLLTVTTCQFFWGGGEWRGFERGLFLSCLTFLLAWENLWRNVAKHLSHLNFRIISNLQCIYNSDCILLHLVAKSFKKVQHLNKSYIQLHEKL